MTLNDFGEVAADCWNEIPAHFDNVATPAFGVMPNHIHGIVHLIDATRRGKACLAPTTENGLTVGHFGKPVPGSLPTVVGAYKSAVTQRINKLRGKPGVALWQRNYYEHVIRSDKDYLRIERYICDNPFHWFKDDEFPFQMY